MGTDSTESYAGKTNGTSIFLDLPHESISPGTTYARELHTPDVMSMNNSRISMDSFHAPTNGTSGPSLNVNGSRTETVQMNIPKPSSNTPKSTVKKGREIVQHFRLAWFAMIMGWSGTAIVIDGFPGASGDFKYSLNIIGTVVWLWGLAYSIVFLVAIMARLISYPAGFWMMMQHPQDSLFFGCLPMGMAVLCSGFVLFGPNIMPEAVAFMTAQVLFWITVAGCVMSMTLLPYLMMVTHIHQHHTMTSLWLLPLVTCVVQSATAGVVGPAQYSPAHQQNILIAGYILWGAGILAAAPVIAAFLSRLIVHGLPSGYLGNSVWVVLGPIGQGSNAIIMLGRNTLALQCAGYFCALGEGSADPLTCACSGERISTISSWGVNAPGMTLMVGVVMWGTGCWWLFIACVTSISSTYKGNRLARFLMLSDRRRGRKSRRGVMQDSTHSHTSQGTHALTHAHSDTDLQTQTQTQAQTLGHFRSFPYTHEVQESGLSSAHAQDPHSRPEVRMGFTLGWWGSVFPLITLVLSTYQIEIDTGFVFFLWFGRALACALIGLSCYVHAKTVVAVLRRSFWTSFH
ncbi:hypothetical protein SARC_05630 [Sphaeroforma arctica JP610]|uniref:C4-dicarboxylate transporter/malic acid transporter n=1 Tax=Sphaeroforma arctica JP610 TaxID=667725 RepID=A0A0L0FZQ8_9EUKA|nr:hypothetical protein SARC_05630 [Sphaeroforma arctica JP610]KNC82079.1 hypothetical protein SARC_05630 [Sphaeroforma arctica JP610]|eukprot:XP_014155981.1 hypothetical protein SARC_05630 [Sphaeroforma arctica JP610]